MLFWFGCCRLRKKGIVSLSQLANEMLSYANEKLSSKVIVTTLISAKTVIIHRRIFTIFTQANAR